MYIYNVTSNIDDSIHEDWLQWMKETHIPAMLATQKFTAAKMCKVLVNEDMGGVTYSVQYSAKDKATLQQYYIEDADRLRAVTAARYGEKCLAFRTELEIVSEH